MYRATTIDKLVGKRLVNDLKELRMVRTVPGRLASTMFSALYLPAIIFSKEQVKINTSYITIEDDVIGKFRLRCLKMSGLKQSEIDRYTCFCFVLGARDMLMFVGAKTTDELIQKISEPGDNEMSGYVDEKFQSPILNYISELKRVLNKLGREEQHFEGYCSFLEENNVPPLTKFTWIQLYLDYVYSNYLNWPEGYGKVSFIVQNRLRQEKNKFILDMNLMGNCVTVVFTAEEISLLRTPKLIATFLLCSGSKNCKLILQEYGKQTETERRLSKILSTYEV